MTKGGAAQLGTRGRAHPRWRVGALLAAGALLGSLVAPGCSQQEKQRLAEDVAGSVDRRSGRLLVGRLTLTLRPGRMPGGGEIPPQLQGGTLAVFGVVLDAKSRRAAFLGPGEQPLVVYDTETIYARRVVKSAADKRLWSRLELHRLPDTVSPSFDDIIEGAQPGDAVVISPVLLTDLLSGALTGSVRQRKVDKDGNRLITFNTSISKANRELDLDDDDREAREKLLDALAITDDIGPVEVVLRKDGSLSRAKFVFAERPDKQTRLDLEAYLVVTPVDQPPGVAWTAPPLKSTVRVPAFGPLRATVTAQLQQAATPPPLFQQGASG